MRRVATVFGGLALALAATLQPPTVRADILVSTVDVSQSGPAGVLRFDQHSGTVLTVGDVPPFSSAVGPLGPIDVAVGPDGNIYIADGGNILYFDGKTGVPLPSPLGAGQPAGLFAAVPPSSGGLTFTSLAFDSSGQLYAADAALQAIRVFNGPLAASPGVQVDTLLDTVASPPITLTSLAFDQNGDLLASDLDGRAVYRVEVATDTETVVVGQTSSIFGPAGIAVVPSAGFPAGNLDPGDLLIVDLYNSAIFQYDSDGSNEQLFASIPVLPGDIDGGSFPSDIVFDRNGDLLVAVLGGNRQPGEGEGRVLRIDPTGTSITTIASQLIPAGGIAVIDDLLPGDYDGNGMVEAADYEEWKSQFGTAVVASTGADGNGDGVVDAADYTIWRDTLGASGIEAPLGQAATQVPEPNSLWLVLVAAAVVVSVGRSLGTWWPAS